MRLIDADRVREKIEKTITEPSYQHEGEDWQNGLIVAEMFVDDAPTVDATPVIRCKDCKYWCTDDGMFKDIDERQWHHCSHIGIDTEEYFFCSEAERKEE